MGLRGKKADRQFQYWNLRRKGMGQSEIARKYGVSRQVVSRSISRFEKEISKRFLEFSDISAILIDYYDKEKGFMVGNIIPINELSCFILVDDSNKFKVYYDTSFIKGQNNRKKSTDEMISLINTIFSINCSDKMDFEQITSLILKKEGKYDEKR
jgi:hypothetical protein